jgi:sec-independent protein translocase protein TatA
MPHLGPLEIGLILLLVLIVFGVGKLPGVGAALGKSIREFNRAKNGENEAKKEEEPAVINGQETKKTA